MRLFFPVTALSMYISFALSAAAPAAALPFMSAKKREAEEVETKKSEAKPVKKETTHKSKHAPADRLEKEATPSLPVPVGFTPAKVGTAIGALTAHHDPLTIYRNAGISPVEERAIRQAAADYEGMLRVRLKLLENLNKQMTAFQYQSEPDTKAVLAKQDEINKLVALMANDRVKILFAIRDCMTHDERVRLVEELERQNGIQHVEPKVEPETKSEAKSEAKSDADSKAEADEKKADEAEDEALMQTGGMAEDAERQKSDKPDKTDRTEKSEKPEKSEKAENPSVDAKKAE